MKNIIIFLILLSSVELQQTKQITINRIIPVIRESEIVEDKQTDYAICHPDKKCEIKSSSGELIKKIYFPPKHESRHDISPDGKTNCMIISHRSGLAAKYKLALQNRLSRDTINIGLGINGIWSSNSKFLFYLKLDSIPNNKKDLIRFDVEKQISQRITTNSNVSNFSIIPNIEGSKVIFKVNHLTPGKGLEMVDNKSHTSALIIYDLVNDTFTEIYRRDFYMDSELDYISWSPDGNLFVYRKVIEYKQDSSTHWEVRPSKADIFISNSSGEIIAQLTDNPNIVECCTRWISDNLIYYWIESSEWSGGKDYLFELMFNE